MTDATIPTTPPSQTSRPTLGFVGAGKVGQVLARLWFGKGYTIAAVYSRTGAHAIELASQVHAAAVTSPDDVIADCDLTLLTVPDDTIAPLSAELSSPDWAGKAVVHTSGAHSLKNLQLLANLGVMTGSLHPAYPFSDVPTGLRGLAGAAFAVESSHEVLNNWLTNLVTALDGRVITLKPEQKAAYHAALVLTSNYTVTLFAAAERLLMSVGAAKADADHALNTLLGATVDNIRQQGIPSALTGPLVRDDTGTIAAHLESLQGDVALAEAYRALARLSYPMLVEQSIATATIEATLKHSEILTDPKSESPEAESEIPEATEVNDENEPDETDDTQHPENENGRAANSDDDGV